ncbi:heavy metal-associated isoprenylated plant protein 41-like [Phragmites australis]|uniref:heavy metal-associated isoprenylated plant protein 41-like n=1 Tax=Phragmites australis TaxID=29695 RepID=UPI002D769E7C|nr:heavy metal-associated isoprenylated plant protein 41-like [Phragmites australis]
MHTSTHGDGVASPEPPAGEEGVKWVKHYSSAQSILIVGDGDFSFLLALATTFGSGANLVATSLDTYEALKGKYSKAESNIMGLKRLGATNFHGVDMKTMKFHTDLKNRRFNRIVFNFPHATFNGPENQLHVINLHKELVRVFFRNACHLLMPYGEIHVSHKTRHPYDRWNLEHLASESSLVMIEKVGFHTEDYPGYNQKRGDGARCDKSFNLDPCCTVKLQSSEPGVAAQDYLLKGSIK